MQNCLGVHSVSSMYLIGLLITGNTLYTNLHLKITWKFHLLHTVVAIHLLMGVSQQDFVTSVPHCLPLLPVHFLVWYYTLVQVQVSLNSLVPWYTKVSRERKRLSLHVWPGSWDQKGMKNVTCFPGCPIRMWAGLLIGHMAKPVFSLRLSEGRRWAVLIDKGATSPWWVEVEMILGFR